MSGRHSVKSGRTQSGNLSQKRSVSQKSRHSKAVSRKAAASGPDAAKTKDSRTNSAKQLELAGPLSKAPAKVKQSHRQTTTFQASLSPTGMAGGPASQNKDLQVLGGDAGDLHSPSKSP